MKRICLFTFLCLQVLLVSADEVKGRVVDADSGEPLEGAQVEVMMSENNYYYMFHLSTDSCGILSLGTGNFMCRLSMKITYFGYEELKVREFVAMGGKDTLDLGDLKLKMSAELLKEVVVKGKAKQFYMKGDTVVFNPEAFQFEDGARVSELMRKLPGVRIEDGQLTFNGKPVHLKMNGHDITDDFLAAQLPAEAVQNIKAYEKKSELAEQTGMNDGQERQILDITIKPGFMDKWYGQTKASAYTSKNYRASANMHYLSDKNPWGVYARASDCGSKTYGVWGEHESDWETAVPQRQQYGKLSYQHNWKVKNARTSYDEDKWNVNTTPSHLDTHQNTWSNSETFLSGQPSTFSNSHSYNYNHGWEVPLSLGTDAHLGSRTWLSLNIDGGYKKGEVRSDSDQETYRAEQYSGAPQSLVNSSEGKRISRTETGHLSSDVYLTHAWDKADFYATLHMRYNHDKDHSDNHTDYDYRELGTSETLDQSAHSWTNNLQVIFDTKYSFQIIPKKLKAGAAFWFYGLHNTSESEMLSNGKYDLTNSYDRRRGVSFYEPRFEMEADLGKVWLLGRIKMADSDERLDYHRGKLDTVIHHNTWFPRPHFEFKWKTTKTTELKGGFDWEHATADLLESSSYTDDTNPLFITRGNPYLKGTSTLRSDLSYNMVFPKGQQMLSWNLRYIRDFDPVTSASTYDTLTGGYTSTRVNVDDKQRWSAVLNYDRALGSYFRMRSRMGYDYTQDHGIKTMTSLDHTMEQYEQRVSSFSGNLSVTFENNGWECTAFGTFSYDGVTYSDPTLSGQQLWDYRIELNGIYKMKHWTFSLSPRLIGNAGYLSNIMNRNRFCLDASVTWKTLKGKGLLALSAKDIFNKMDQVFYNISPTQRSETRSETFHRYLALTFTYNFDAKAKKGGKK